MRTLILGANLILTECDSCPDHSLANRHSCSTSAETRDRKCGSMQLILVVGKMDMIN